MSWFTETLAARFRPGGLLVISLLFLSACTQAPVIAPDTLPPRLSVRNEITNTPFFPQQRFQCGPAALATVLSFRDTGPEPDALVRFVYLPERKGSLQTEMLATARAFDRIAYTLTPSIAALLTEVANGNPVVVLQNLGLRWLPRWHYAVVVGYDMEKQILILRSGTEKRKHYSFTLFDRTWRRSGRWAMVAVAPGRVPASASESAYLHAILPFEQGNKWHIANSAYLAATRHWPGSLGAYMGLGNSYYALKNPRRARDAYRQALTIDSEHAPAHNNLAQVLMDGGDLVGARSHARRAVTIGGPHVATYRKTLTEIGERTGRN